MAQPFRHPIRVRYAECDPQSVVFNAHYFAYFDLALTELWRAALGSYGAMHDHGIDVVVGEATARFLAPARFDDELEAEVTIARIGTTGITIRYELRREGELLVEGSVRYVVVDLGTQAKTPVPDWLREALAPYTAA
jgi:acyl-CoA thioester hydrolase